MADIPLLKKALSESHVVAVVGMSNKSHRPSYFVGKYLLDHGYRMIPVNPTFDEVLGCKSYPSLADIPEKVDMVDCFRRSEMMPALAAEAAALAPKFLWMQLGVVSEEARRIAEQNHIEVIEDRCVKIEHARLFGGLGWAGVNTGIISAKRPRQINL